MGVELAPAQALRLLEEIKLKESRGYQYEGAEASFEMLVSGCCRTTRRRSLSWST